MRCSERAASFSLMVSESRVDGANCGDGVPRIRLTTSLFPRPGVEWSSFTPLIPRDDDIYFDSLQQNACDLGFPAETDTRLSRSTREKCRSLCDITKGREDGFIVFVHGTVLFVFFYGGSNVLPYNRCYGD